MGQINTNNYPAVDSLLDADLLIVENATHGTGTTTPKQLRENAIGTDPLQTTAQTVTGAINEIFEMATDTVVGLELGKMTSFSDGVIVTDIDLHRAPVAGDRILFYHSTSVASPSSLTTYNDGVAVTTTIGDFSLTHPAGLTLMKCVALGESLRWQTVQDIASGYTAGVGISINGTTINNSAPQLGDDIAYSRIDTVTSGALGYFSADADCLVMDFRTDAEPYNGGYTLRLTTTGASFKYAVLKDKAGNNYAEEIPSGSLVLCKSNVSGTGSEADPVVVTVLEIGNAEMAHDVEVLKDICITEKTVSGNPITLSDALPYNAVTLSAEIEAEQDLHGYDHPWVGGAGLNKFDGTYQPYYISGGDSAQYAYDANCMSVVIPIVGGNKYTISTSGGNRLIVGTTPTAPSTGDVVSKLASYYDIIPEHITVTTDASAAYLIAYVSSSQTTVQTMVEVGETAHPYEPYSNICPISGRDSVAVDDVGANLIDPTAIQSGGIDAGGHEISVSGFSRTGYTPVNDAIFALIGSTAVGYTVRVHGYNASKQWVEQIDYFNSGAMDKTYTVPNGIAYIRVSYPTNGADFILSQGHAVTIQLGQTVYGGSLNLTTGGLTIDYALVDMGGLTWNYVSNMVGFYTDDLASLMNKPASNLVSFHGLCEAYPIVAREGIPYEALCANVNGRIVVRTALYGTNATLFGNAMSGIHLCYELATPTTIQLTPEQLTMLKGYNRLSGDGGGDITLTYKADRLAAIEAALAELQ